MYIPAQYAVHERAHMLELMRSHAFAPLLSTHLQPGSGGATPPVIQTEITYLPWLIVEDGERLLLRAHLALANPHWRRLQESGADAVQILFQGPHTYVSPTLYANALQVPTWNYMVVHAHGRLTSRHEDEFKLQTLQDLVEFNEPSWQSSFGAMPEAPRNAMLRAIVGVEVEVTSLEAKFKLSQHREGTELPTMRTTHEQGDANQREIAAWMKKLGYWQDEGAA